MRDKSNSDSIRIIRPMKLAERLDVNHSTIWRWEKSGVLPASRRLGPGIRGWLESEIVEWLESRERDAVAVE